MQTQTPTIVETVAYGRTRQTCSLCGDVVQGRVADTPEQRLAEHAARIHPAPEVGDYLAEWLVTDCIVWKVTHVTTAGSLTLARTTDNGIAENREVDGNPWPVTSMYVDGPSAGGTVKVRLRKDGTYRIGTTGRPLRPAPLKNGRPVRVTDYRY